jgi:two-component sensor histidine kinase
MSTFKTLPLDKHIAVDVSPSSIQVGSKYANCLALVMNELATNTIKYGLAGRLAGHITVRIENEGEWILVEFRDDGPGFPEEILRQERHNVGLHLIRTIVQRDLDGELNLHNHKGAVTTIRFKPQPQSGRTQ